nr:hypothetical protein TorRG33x02_150170 [Ipomoea batatas]
MQCSTTLPCSGLCQGKTALLFCLTKGEEFATSRNGDLLGPATPSLCVVCAFLLSLGESSNLLIFSLLPRMFSLRRLRSMRFSFSICFAKEIGGASLVGVLSAIVLPLLSSTAWFSFPREIRTGFREQIQAPCLPRNHEKLGVPASLPSPARAFLAFATIALSPLSLALQSCVLLLYNAQNICSPPPALPPKIKGKGANRNKGLNCRSESGFHLNSVSLQLLQSKLSLHSQEITLRPQHLRLKPPLLLRKIRRRLDAVLDSLPPIDIAIGTRICGVENHNGDNPSPGELPLLAEQPLQLPLVVVLLMQELHRVERVAAPLVGGGGGGGRGLLRGRLGGLPARPPGQVDDFWGGWRWRRLVPFHPSC